MGTCTIEVKEQGLGIQECFAKVKENIKQIIPAMGRVYLVAVVTMRHFSGMQEQLELASKAEEYEGDFDDFFDRAVLRIESKMEKRGGVLKRIDMIKFNYISY